MERGSSLFSIFEKKEKPLQPSDIGVRFAEYYKKNNMDVPPIEVLMLFTRHSSESDASWMEKYYKDADIFIPEAHGWTDELLDFFQGIADGKIQPDKLMANASRFSKEVASFMGKNPGKKITLIDAHREARFFKENGLKNQADSDILHKILASGFSFAEAAEKNYEIAKSEVPYNDAREQMMLKVLPMQIGELVRQHPELKKKKNLKVVMYLGTTHTRMYQWMKERGDNVQRKFQGMPQDFTENSALVLRAEHFNRPFSSETKQRLLFSVLIQNKTFLAITKNNFPDGIFNTYLKFIMKNLPLSDMKSLYEIVRRNPNSSEFGRVFEETLRKNYLPIIKTRADLPQEK